MVLGAAFPECQGDSRARMRVVPGSAGGLSSSCPGNFTPWASAFLHVPEHPPPPPLAALFTLSFLPPVVSAQVLFLLAPVQLCSISYCVLSVSKWPILVTFPSSDSGERLDLVIFLLDLEYRWQANLCIICLVVGTERQQVWGVRSGVEKAPWLARHVFHNVNSNFKSLMRLW